MLAGMFAPRGGGGGGGGGGPYRYIRIYITQNNGDATFCSITECEMRIGGVDQCVGGTASASSAHVTGPAGDAFDGSLLPTDSWVSSGVVLVPQWLKYDFGAGNEKSIEQVALYPETNNLLRAPRNFQIQGSNDDSSWDVLSNQVGITGWSAAYKTFDL